MNVQVLNMKCLMVYERILYFDSNEKKGQKQSPLLQCKTVQEQQLFSVVLSCGILLQLRKLSFKRQSTQCGLSVDLRHPAYASV